MTQSKERDISDEAYQSLVNWINTHLIESNKIYPQCSYWWKHRAEKSLGTYIGEDHFIEAARECGYRGRPIKGSKNSYRFYFKPNFLLLHEWYTNKQISHATPSMQTYIGVR